MTEIPPYEVWLYENEAALNNIIKGIKEAEAGEGKYLGSFAKYANDEIE